MTRRARQGVFLAVVAGVGLSALPSCGVRYVASSAVHQVDLLARAEPVAVSLASGHLSAGQEQRLALFAEVKAFGATIGLAATDNYSTYARTWDRRIWNVAACPPLSFTPRTWWFPIVGTVPYLGYFSDEEMNTARVRLEAAGDEVAVREVGAYSTLGWFRDPILPAMLTWDEPRIAGTVSHELAHATLWIPGSVDFNETFASVVGDAAGDLFLVRKYGADSPEVRAARDANLDWNEFQRVIGGLYADLDAVYRDPALTDEAKRLRKAELYDSFDDRVLAAPLRQKPRWLQMVRTQRWNNPRLSQFHTYNTGEAEFLTILAAEGGDIRAFIERIRTITRGARDPFAALREAAAAAAMPAPKAPAP